LQIVEFTADTLRFADVLPARPPSDGFIWVFFDRDEFETHQPLLQQAAQQLGGSALLDLHRQDLANAAHPSHYDFTSIYDLIIFRRLATQAETRAEAETETDDNAHQREPRGQPLIKPSGELSAFKRISSRPVGFVVFDRLLISVHPRGCYTAKSYIDRALSDARFSVDSTTTRSRIPSSPADLVLRMVNSMVDSYLDVRKELTTQLELFQAELLKPSSRFINWGSLMGARSQLHVLEDLCDEQHDAMQEWLDSLRELFIGGKRRHRLLAQ
jgi:magnesium transporter